MVIQVFTNECEISHFVEGRTLSDQYQHVSKNYKDTCNIKLTNLIIVVNNVGSGKKTFTTETNKRKKKINTNGE